MRNREISHVDLEQGGRRSSGLSAEDDESACFSDADDGDGSCRSQFYSTTGGSYDEYSFACASDREATAPGAGAGGPSSGSEQSVEIEVVEREAKVHLGKVARERERDCRICHLGLESNSHEYGVAIELGCACKDDLATAHKNCAETWFKIKGNKTCEICQSIARNVSGASEIEATEQSNETHNATAASAVLASIPPSETRSFWHGHRLLNFLLACMVFAFVISWLFHFRMPSS
ncbi:RING-CH-type domain-containing protein [Psidium guajava]|nr:RING-CH-type domain-containing protein [Psidium guajava]